MSAENPTAYPQVVAGRSCQDCTLCCKLMSIPTLAKPAQKWCDHCDKGKGCRIYDSRPEECRAFHCGYLINPGLGEHWKPATSHMVLDYHPSANRISIHIDVGRVNAWRNEPYFSTIKQWATVATQNGGYVVVWQGLNAVIVFPNSEKNIGQVREDQVIITSKKTGPSGPIYDALAVDKDDPRLQRVKSSGAHVTDLTSGGT